MQPRQPVQLPPDLRQGRPGAVDAGIGQVLAPETELEARDAGDDRSAEIVQTTVLIERPADRVPLDEVIGAQGLGVKPFTEEMEVLYFSCCYLSYAPRLKKVLFPEAE